MTWRANKSEFRKMPVPKGAKKRPREYIDPEAFYLMRRRAFLTTQKAATALGVTQRTLLNWEKGQSRIPYTAFRTLKILAGYVFNDEHFKDWFVKGDTLWSPEGRGFKPHELRYVANYFAIARLWIKERQELKAKPLPDSTIPARATSDDSPAALTPHARARVVTGDLLSSCGAASPYVEALARELSQGKQKRPPDFEKFLELIGLSE